MSRFTGSNETRSREPAGSRLLANTSRSGFACAAAAQASTHASAAALPAILTSLIRPPNQSLQDAAAHRKRGVDQALMATGDRVPEQLSRGVLSPVKALR